MRNLLVFVCLLAVMALPAVGGETVWGRVPRYVVSSDAEIESAIAQCGASQSPALGCTIEFCGEILTDGISFVDSNREGIRFIGCGGGNRDGNGDAIGGAVLTFDATATPAAVLTIDGCSDCEFSNFGIDGNEVATSGINMPGRYTTSRNLFDKVSVSDINGNCFDVATWTGATDCAGSNEYCGQVDFARFNQAECFNSDGALQQGASNGYGDQAVHTVLDGVRFANMNNDADRYIDVYSGGITIRESYLGVPQGRTSSGAVTGIFIDDDANTLIERNRFEFGGTHSAGDGIVTVIEIGDGGGISDTRSIRGNTWNQDNASVGVGYVCLNVDARGSVTIQDNSLISTGGVGDCTVVLENSADNGALAAFLINNANRLDADTSDYELWPWNTNGDDDANVMEIGMNTGEPAVNGGIRFNFSDDVQFVPDADSATNGDGGRFEIISSAGVNLLVASEADNSLTLGSASTNVILAKIQNDCSTVTTNGAMCWDDDNDILYIGNGTSAIAVGP